MAVHIMRVSQFFFYIYFDDEIGGQPQPGQVEKGAGAFCGGFAEEKAEC